MPSARYRRARSEPNAYVVLVDITLAVAFFLIVFAITFAMNNSQSIFKMTREERQVLIRGQFADALCTALQGRRGTWNSEERRLPIVGPNGVPVAEIFENASYQRISIYAPQFERGSSLPTEQSRSSYRQIGAVIATNRKSFSYLQLQGVAEPSELSNDAERKALSRARADSAEDVLVQEGLIRGASSQQDRATSPWMDLQFVVPFGVGSRLYADWQGNRRVDFIVFYPDNEQ